MMNPKCQECKARHAGYVRALEARIKQVREKIPFESELEPSTDAWRKKELLRTVAYAHTSGGMTITEIAKVTGVTRQTVYRWLEEFEFHSPGFRDF